MSVWSLDRGSADWQYPCGGASRKEGLRAREADATNASWERLSTVRGRGAQLGVEGPLVLAAVLLGLNFVAIKVAVESIPPLLVGARRFTVGGCCSCLSCG